MKRFAASIMNPIQRLSNWLWSLIGNRKFVTIWLTVWIVICSVITRMQRSIISEDNNMKSASQRSTLCVAALVAILAYHLKGDDHEKIDEPENH